METGCDGSLNSWAGPAPGVIQATMCAKAARQAQQTKEELEKIQARIDHMIQAYERSERVSAAQPAAMEVVEDVEQLEAVLGDPMKKRRYQHQVTVFIVGYQESCGQRNSLLRQLQEFFNCSVELGLGEESPGLSDDFPVHLDDVADTVTAALSSVEAAASRLADLNKDIVSYLTSALAAHSPKRSHRKQVEKAVDKAKEELVQLKRRLLQAQADLETKERQLKDLQQLSEMKAKESRLCRAQLESSQRRLQGLEQEHGAQQACLEAELRSRDSRIAELDGFLQERARLQRDAATQCSDRAPSSAATCPGGLLLSSAGAAAPAGTGLGDGLAESMVRPGGGVPDPVDPPGQHSEQPQLGAGGPLAHTAVPGPGELAGLAGGCREAREAEEDAAEQTETSPAGGERSPAAMHGAVQAPEDSAMCELLAQRLAALEAELAEAQLQSREEAQRWEMRCRAMAAAWEEERQRLLHQTRQLAETARHQQTAQTAETVRYLATARPAETVQNLETTWPTETVQNLQMAQPAETAQNLEPARQEQPMRQAEAVQPAQRGQPAPQVSAPGSPLTLEARGFPEPTPPPTPAGGASPSRGPIRKGAVPGPESAWHRESPAAGGAEDVASPPHPSPTGSCVDASPDALPHADGRTSPAVGRPGADSSLVAFMETLREGLMAKELYSLARLLDGPWDTQTPELSAAPQEAAGAESRRLLGNATVVFNSLLESISDNYEMLLQQQAVPSDQEGAKARAPGKGVALSGTGPLALDQSPVGGGHSTHAIVLAPGQPTHMGGELNPRPAPSSARAERRAPRVRFIQQDEQHNRRALSQGVCRGQVPWALYQDASLLMAGFRWLCRQRFEGLVRGYLAHVYMKEAEEALEQRPSSSSSVEARSVLGRLRALRQQRLWRWRGEWHRTWVRRLQLAELLSETLGRVEERLGLLLIRPVLPGPGRWSHARPQATPKKPVPAQTGQLQEASSPLATWDIQLHAPKEARPHMLWSFPAVGGGGSWPEWDPVLSTPVVITPRLLEMDLNGYLLQEHQVSRRSQPGPGPASPRARPLTASLRSFLPLRRGVARVGPSHSERP